MTVEMEMSGFVTTREDRHQEVKIGEKTPQRENQRVNAMIMKKNVPRKKGKGKMEQKPQKRRITEGKDNAKETENAKSKKKTDNSEMQEQEEEKEREETDR